MYPKNSRARIDKTLSSVRCGKACLHQCCVQDTLGPSVHASKWLAIEIVDVQLRDATHTAEDFLLKQKVSHFNISILNLNDAKLSILIFVY